MHPVDGVDAAGRRHHVVGVALVADGGLDQVAQLDVETVRVPEQQAGTHARPAEHPGDVGPTLPVGVVTAMVIATSLRR